MSSSTTWNVLRGMAVIRGVTMRKNARDPWNYLFWGGAVAVTVAIQRVTGLGAVSVAERPESQAVAVAVLAGLALSVVLTGLGGPVWSVYPHEAQWIVTAPGGARALVAWRTGRGLLTRFVDVLLIVPAAQVTSGDRPDFAVAAVLATWYAGIGLCSSGIRYGVAAAYARSRRHWLGRGAAALLMAGLYLLLQGSPGAMHVLGLPGTGSSAGALLAAGVWLLMGLLVAAVGISRAESLVERAIAEGDPVRRGARRRWWESRTTTREPETFVLTGARAFGWLSLTRRRKNRRVQPLATAALLGITLGVARWWPAWTPAVAGALAVMGLLVALSPGVPVPIQADGRLLPVPLRAAASWTIGLATISAAFGMGIPWSVALGRQAGDPWLLLAGSVCLLPVALLSAVLQWQRTPDIERAPARARRLGAIAAVALGGAAALAWGHQDLHGALLAAAWIVLVSGALAWHSLRQLELALRPSRP